MLVIVIKIKIPTVHFSHKRSDRNILPFSNLPERLYGIEKVSLILSDTQYCKTFEYIVYVQVSSDTCWKAWLISGLINSTPFHVNEMKINKSTFDFWIFVHKWFYDLILFVLDEKFIIS